MITKRKLSSTFDAVYSLLNLSDPSLVPLANFTARTWMWATTMVSAHSFVVTGEGATPDSEAQEAFLLPLLQCIRHDFVNTSYRVSEGNLVIETLTPFAKDEEVFINRGALGNSALLMRYGRAIRANPYNAVPIVLSFNYSLGTPLQAAKQRMLARAGLKDINSFALHYRSLPPELMLALRIDLMEAKHLDMFDSMMNQTAIVSLENELNVLRTIWAYTRQLQAESFHTTQEDVARLAGGGAPLSLTEQAILTARLAEYELIASVRDAVADRWLAFLRT